MFSDSSLPVKTPSYDISLGYQALLDVNILNCDTNNKNVREFFGYAFESGHYSNGQSFGMFYKRNLDGTKQSFRDGSKENDSIYSNINSNTDLSEILNRENGEFSTNYLNVKLSYKYFNLGKNNFYTNMHSISFGMNVYQNSFLFFIPTKTGGIEERDKSIYGTKIFKIEYEYLHNFNEKFQLSTQLKYEGINGAHETVNPHRFEGIISLYPFPIGCLDFSENIGVSFSLIRGHDNYNIRFVDSGNQFAIGLNWRVLPRLQM